MYCRCQRQTCKVGVDQRLAATEATCTGPCSALLPQTTKHIKKKGRETTLPLVVLAGNLTPEREKSRKKIEQREREEERV